MQRVLVHIDAHLDENLSIAILSAVAAFSPFHFQRQFSALFGVTVHHYVQMCRLKRASYRLAFRDAESITQIALDSGYEGPEAFARAFKQRIGQTPSDFRTQPQWGPWQTVLGPVNIIRSTHMTDYDASEVRIVEVPATPIALMEHRGDPDMIFATVQRFIAWRRAEKLPPKLSATFNIWYDNPDEVAPEDFRMGLGAATSRAIAANDAGVVASIIPAGRCAVLRHVGSDATLKTAAMHLYADWLPRSGEEPRDFPPYCRRVSFFPDVPEHEAVTDIFLPLK